MQEFIKWRDEWSLGVDTLDAQHRDLADCLNRLVRECLHGHRSENKGSIKTSLVIQSLLDELYRKTKEHFSYEEAMMREEKYPGYISHAREHAMLLGELKSTFTAKVKEGCSDIDPELLSELKYWFIAHVSRSDREFADFLDNKGKSRSGST